MKTKAYKYLSIILSSISFIISILLLILFLTSKEKNPNEIFNQNIGSIVEVKAYEDDYESYGSGVFVDETHFITNAHVIKKEKSGIPYILEKIEIRFFNEDNYRNTTLIKYDYDKDLAYLEIVDEDLSIKPIKIENSDTISNGDTVYAIGNGMNHGLGITNGIISLPLVNIEFNNVMHSVIQSDVIINNGNSGGALLNSNGDLIGITSFRLKETLGNTIYGVAYSIPSNILLDFIK